ncbi:MAG TPA: S8 family serine peptidase [Vicinamibacterales bacterium]|nr:S8 family serine peptidase [Vicinamibacterales bacterium]
MTKKLTAVLLAALLVSAAPAFAATLSPTLQAKLASASPGDSVGVVIVAFHDGGPLTDTHLGVLRAAGISAGKTLPTLGMVAVSATVAQVRTLAQQPSVRSIWTNEPLAYDMHQARVLTGIDRLRTDAGLTKLNGGMPVSGQGNFSVVVNDSGIDGTHADLKYGPHVVQNVQIVTDTDTAAGFTPLLAIENVPNTDSHVGHGTHVAGIIGGTGQQSGGLYAGVAPGVRLIGTGSGAGLFILNALGGFEWSLANQFRYNIRVINNSWGSSGAFNPDNPINIATKKAADQNIVVVFSAGNSGSGWDTHNPYAKAPWVISVAAGTKEGGLANFSSRGTPKEQRLGNADPLDDFDAPTITAPGTGRQFTNNTKFTTDIVSVRSSTDVVSNGGTDDLQIPPAFLPFYTQISGTSMSAPHIAGVAALILDADPTLSAAEVKEIMMRTATRTPGLEDFETGVGYVNAHAAVDLAFRRSKPYGSFLVPAFNATVTTTWGPDEPHSLDFIPAPPGPDSPNTFRFQVEPGINLLSVIADFGKSPVTDETGNAMGLVLWPPGCQQPMSPTGPRPPCTYSSGLALPALNGPKRQVVVRNPVPGEWIAEFGGVRGLAAVPEASSPVGISLPDRIDSRVSKAVFSLPPVADVTGHAFEASIYEALLNRRTDLKADGLYHPDELVTREDFARHLALVVPVRQTLGNAPRFSDVSGDLAAIAEAVTARGATLRDHNFSADGLMSASGSAFDPAGTVSRLDVAVALVRALGRDAEAKAKAGTTVMWNGQPITDNAAIPAALRGYVQVALDLGLLETFPAEVIQTAPGQFLVVPGPRFEPGAGITRGRLAGKLSNFARIFATTF